MELQTIYSPLKTHLKEIEKYLVSEHLTSNLSSVINSFNRGELIVLFLGDELIGFSAYRINNPISAIDVFEIKLNYRNKGYGKKLVNNTLREIKSQKGEIAELFCSPKSSESFWKSVGFLNFPDFPHNSEIWMFKALSNTTNLLDISEYKNDDEIIELWDNEPHLASKVNSNWKWKLEFKPNTLILINPIIFPAHYDWQICWRKDDMIIEKRKVKSFESANILNGHFIIIRELIN